MCELRANIYTRGPLHRSRNQSPSLLSHCCRPFTESLCSGDCNRGSSLWPKHKLTCMAACVSAFFYPRNAIHRKGVGGGAHASWLPAGTGSMARGCHIARPGLGNACWATHSTQPPGANCRQNIEPPRPIARHTDSPYLLNRTASVLITGSFS